jgi:predicted nicotinamide N-methyase
MTVPEARKDRRIARYPLRRLRIPMGDGVVSIVMPKGSAALAEPGSARGGEPPYWADLWPASVAIARWICRRRAAQGLRVLDLGCGLGLPGSSAVRCGAAVTFADFQPDALAFAEFHGKQQLHPELGAEEVATRVRCVAHDWNGDPLPGPFDWILLADVSYRPRHHLPILRQLRAGLSENGLAIHADPERRESDGFLAQLRREFSVREEIADTHVDGERHRVRMAFVARSPEILDSWFARSATPA